MKKAIPQILGDMSELNSHDGLKTGLLQFSCRNQKTCKLYRGNLRDYRGNLREYRGNLQTDVSTILKPTFQACVAMAQEFQEPASLFFFSTEPIPRIHGAQTYQRTRLWVPQLGKIIYRIFIVLSQFLFSIAFFRTKMVHRVFFWHLGFAGF